MPHLIIDHKPCISWCVITISSRFGLSVTRRIEQGQLRSRIKIVSVFGMLFSALFHHFIVVLATEIGHMTLLLSYDVHTLWLFYRRCDLMYLWIWLGLLSFFDVIRPFYCMSLISNFSLQISGWYRMLTQSFCNISGIFGLTVSRRIGQGLFWSSIKILWVFGSLLPTMTSFLVMFGNADATICASKMSNLCSYVTAYVVYDVFEYHWDRSIFTIFK